MAWENAFNGLNLQRRQAKWEMPSKVYAMEKVDWIAALIAALAGGVGGVVVSLMEQYFREKKSAAVAVYEEFHKIEFDVVRKSAYIALTSEETIQEATRAYGENEEFFQEFAHKHDEVRQIMHFLNRIVICHRNGHFNNALLRDLLGVQLVAWYSAFRPYISNEPKTSGLRGFLDNLRNLRSIGT